MLLLNKNEAFKILVFLSCFILMGGRALSNDTLYVKFIDKKIDLTKYGSYSTVKVKKTLYLFCWEKDDSLINCFAFKGNVLISSGRLTVQKENALFVAERSGYWKFFNAKNKVKKVYFDDGEPLKEEYLPIEESSNDFYIKN